jgi:predicted esterase
MLCRGSHRRRWPGARGSWLIPCGVVAWACGAAPVAEPGAGAVGGAVRRLDVPTVPLERDALAAIPKLRSDRVTLAVAVPEHLDPARVHPILITQVTAHAHRPNVAALTDYAPVALELGYVVITAQGIPWPDTEASDTIMHRYASVRAALRWLASEIPQSERWPIVLAGFSGGAKMSQVLAISLTLEKRRVAGVFLGGCNEDHFPLLLAHYPTVKEAFSRIAFFLSVGTDDRISPPAAVRAVARQLRSSGVEHLELSVYPGGHRLDTQDLSLALRWFRTLIQQGDVQQENVGRGTGG